MNVGESKNVTFGDSIPRLLEGSRKNFSIPLDGVTIAELFSASSLSCSSENALVTFNGLSARSVLIDAEKVSDEQLLISVLPSKTLRMRQDITSTVGAAATSNGIVFASGSPVVSSSSSAATSQPSSSDSLSIESTTLDFARVAVLYVLQSSGQLDDAITAQKNLQNYFASGTTSTGQHIDAANITLGAGFTANLGNRKLASSNGTVV